MPTMIDFYVHAAQSFITCYSNFFPLTYKKTEEKNNKRFKLTCQCLQLELILYTKSQMVTFH